MHGPKDHQVRKLFAYYTSNDIFKKRFFGYKILDQDRTRPVADYLASRIQCYFALSFFYLLNSCLAQPNRCGIESKFRPTTSKTKSRHLANAVRALRTVCYSNSEHVRSLQCT
jgi:hypothetical protein